MNTQATLVMDGDASGRVYKGLRAIGGVHRQADGRWSISGQPEATLVGYRSARLAAAACARIWGAVLK